jgi:polar amino acid transport system permease protein
MYGSYLSQLLHGLAVTAEITTFAAVLATLFAVIGGVGLASTNPLLRGVSRVYVEIFRGTSLLVQLFWIYYVLPSFGLSLDPFAAGVAAIALNGGAYGAEAVRGAIQALPRGQWEAAKAMGLPRRVTLHKVILPQACIFLLPQWGNFLIESMKATAVVSFISITDLSFVGYQINARTFDTITVYGLVLLIYFAFSQIIIVPARAAERRYRLRGINTASRAERAA